MAEKILNTRIQSKIDTLENWNKSEIGLLKGEIAIATVAAEAGNGLQEPVYMIKIGEDGIKTFKDLEWNLYAKASDVLAACKDENSFKDFVNEIMYESDFITELDKKFSNLNVADTAEEGKYVSSVSQENGVIKVTRESFPDFLQNISISIEEHEGIKECLVIKDSKSNVLSYVDASRFVKDGMLDSASYDSASHKLTLTWNTDAGKENTEIDLNNLVDVYSGDNGIEITEDKVIQLSENVLTSLDSLLNNSIQTITTDDIVKSETETVPSGLIATKGENNDYNIAIDDSITFIFNCGDAGITTE